MEQFWTQFGMELLAALICAVCGWLGAVVRAYLNDERKRSIAASAVHFVEQVFTQLHGQEKLDKALQTAQQLLKKRGIPFDQEEMQILIESTLAQFNASLRQE